MRTDPLIITCAPLGAELGLSDTPHLPITIDKLVTSSVEAVQAGACIIHIHVRDENAMPTQRKDIFQSVTEKILSRTDCIIQYSTGGAVGTPLKARCAPLDLVPEMATLSMGTMNFGSDIFENKETTIKAIAKKMEQKGVMPELEIFDLGMLETALRMKKKGFIPNKVHMNFVLGVPGGMGGSIEDLLTLKQRLKSGQNWTVSGVGKFQLPLTAHAIAMGGHVRLGFEDNIYYRKNELAESNAMLVKRAIRLAEELERPVAGPSEAREILSLEKR